MTELFRRTVLAGLGVTPVLSGARRARAAGSLVIWWGQGFYQQEDRALRDLVAAFAKETGIAADLQLINGPDLITKFIAGLQVGDVPDVVQTNTGWTFLQPQAAWNDQLTDLSDVIAPREKEFLPAALDACRYYNKVLKKRSWYAVPIKGATLTEQIWRPMLHEAGFGDGDLPKTHDAFYDFFQVVQDKLRSKGKRLFGLGYSMATRDSDSNTLFNSFLIAYGGAGIVTSDGALHVDGSIRAAAVKALERLTTPYKNGYVPPGAINWGDADNNSAFLGKQIVMTPNASISIPVAQMEKADQYYKEIITTGIPAGNDGKSLPNVLQTVGAFVPKAAKNVDNAKAFLRWFTDPARLNGYQKEIRGRFLPVYPAALKTDPYWLDPSDPHRPVAAKYGLIEPTIAPWQTYTPAYAQVVSEQVWTAAEANITQKGMTPEQAADLAIDRIKGIFARFPMD